ncbi:MAG: hypothetical protein SF123_07755 [Chloroflexota bacterium]|nr:hypothetical protein [Chloroflexota bacterium]
MTISLSWGAVRAAAMSSSSRATGATWITYCGRHYEVRRLLAGDCSAAEVVNVPDVAGSNDEG